jgi:5-carboxymethyl-2-hydroxymuconic-semialdehyde dehydrogenase
VTAIITPWNAPLMLATWRIGPALAAGNTVVLKPPEWAPLTASLLADIADEAGLPAGSSTSFRAAVPMLGRPSPGTPGINRLSFTGSVPTAGIIAAAAAPNIVPLSFELGGKSPLLVFDDSDLDLAVIWPWSSSTTPARCAWAPSGCSSRRASPTSSSRESWTGPGTLVQGDPRDEETDVSALVSRAHFDRVSGFVERAIADGAKPVLGGGPNADSADCTSPPRSWWVPTPTPRSPRRRSSARC